MHFAIGSLSRASDAPVGSGGRAAAGGALLAAVDGQLAWLDLNTLISRIVTSVSPQHIVDVAAGPSGQAVVSLLAPPPRGETGAWGGDLVRFDLASGGQTTLLARENASESLIAPQWSADRGLLLFERDDLGQPAVAYPAQAVARNPSRVESVRLDGAQRSVLIEDARLPAAAPNGQGIAFVRTNSAGTSLLTRSATGRDTVPVDVGAFLDIGSPRYAPSGDRLAFVATGDARSGSTIAPFWVGTAFAHGLPWDLWLIGADGLGLRSVAATRADDAALAWSPDGRSIFVYGGSGSFVVDAEDGRLTRVPQFAGQGDITWVPAATVR